MGRLTLSGPPNRQPLLPTRLEQTAGLAARGRPLLLQAHNISPPPLLPCLSV